MFCSYQIGCDRSDGLLEVCREREFNIFRCDCLAVPIRSNSIDGCISIAVIHHLASEVKCIEMYILYSFQKKINAIFIIHRRIVVYVL